MLPPSIDPTGETQKMDRLSSYLTPGMFDPLKVLLDILIIILGWVTVSVEVFVRHEFGERYLSWLRLYCAYSIIGVTMAIPMLISVMVADGTMIPYFSYVLAFIGLSLYHRWRIRQRNLDGIQWHSKSFGMSHLHSPQAEKITFGLFALDDWSTYRFFEPLGCFLVGFVCWYISSILGVWIMVASFALLIKNQIVYYKQRGRFLDILDSQIESQYFRPAAKGETKDTTAGFTVLPVSKNPIFANEILDIGATVEETLSQSADAPKLPNGSAKPKLDIKSKTDDVVGAVEG